MHSMNRVVDTPTSVNVRNPGADNSAADRNTVASFKGERLSLRESPQAVLADSLEEMTFSLGETVQKKKIEERNLRSGARSLAMEQAEKYLERVPDLDKDQALKNWIEKIASMPRSSSKEAVLGEIKERFKDPSHAFLALSLAADILQQEQPDSPLLATIEAATAEFEAANKPDIVAGINMSAEACKPEHRALGSAQDLRDLYRDVVRDYQSIGDAFEKVVQEFPGKPMPQALKFLTRSLSADMHASQQEPTRFLQLRTIVADLYQVKQLNTLYGSCMDLLSRCQRQFDSIAADGTIATRMMGYMIELKNSEWGAGKVLDKTLDFMNLTTPKGTIYFLQGFKNMARLIPIKIFNDIHQRARMMESVQQRLDQEIEQEQDIDPEAP